MIIILPVGLFVPALRVGMTRDCGNHLCGIIGNDRCYPPAKQLFGMGRIIDGITDQRHIGRNDFSALFGIKCLVIDMKRTCTKLGISVMQIVG